MSADPLEWLSARNPVPAGSTAPSLESVLARIESAGSRPGRRRIGLPLVPALAVGVTMAVVAAVVVLAVTHLGRTPTHLPPATRTTPPVPSPSSLMPPGGMRGAVFMHGAASASAGHTLFIFSQCQPCHGQAAGSRQRLWLASTLDGGRSWHVARTSLDLTMFAFAGADGWAEGLTPDRAASFFTTHDGGRSWHPASSADPAPGGVGNVSMAGGEVWSLGNGCSGSTCIDAVLRAPAAGNRLAKTVAQPPLGDSTNVSVVATGRNDAYVLNDIFGTDHGVTAITHTQLFATHDGGRTWRSVPTPCSRPGSSQLFRGGAAALWATCSPMHGSLEMFRSADGGRHWTTVPATLGGVQLQPASAQVAWAVGAGGRIVRTTDGGRTWTTAWYPGHPESAVLGGTMPPGLNRAWGTALAVQSATTATVIAVVTRGHVDGHAARTDFVTYRTTDGGHTWRPSVVRLPPG
jgi:photosystem II stability/assembly factor-like uncharacterized protein